MLEFIMVCTFYLLADGSAWCICERVDPVSTKNQPTTISQQARTDGSVTVVPQPDGQIGVEAAP